MSGTRTAVFLTKYFSANLYGISFEMAFPEVAFDETVQPTMLDKKHTDSVRMKIFIRITYNVHCSDDLCQLNISVGSATS
jgi:hypothetical protein